MFYIYEAILIIKKKLFPSIIIIISLIIAFSSGLEFISDISAYNKLLTQISGLAKDNAHVYELYATQDPNLFSNEKAFNDYNDFIKNLSSTAKIKNISSYAYKNYQVKINNKDVLINMVILNKDIDKYFNLRLSTGRYFNISEFNNSDFDIRPIILGSYYNGQTKLGDILECGKMKFKVIGFLENNSPFIMPRSSAGGDNAVSLLDHRALIPITKEEATFPSIKTELLFNGQIIETDSNITRNVLQAEISKLTKEKGFSYYVTNTQSLIDNRFESLKNMLFPIFLSGIILIFSIFSIILTSLASLYMERKNIAIKLALGASDFQVSVSYLIENIIIFLVSIICCTTYFRWDNKVQLQIDKLLQDDQLSLFGILQISSLSIGILGLTSIAIIFITYIFIRINISSIKTNYMKEVV